MEDIKNIFEQYIDNPTVRSTKSIDDNANFMEFVKLYVEQGKINKLNRKNTIKFLYYLTQEELRRLQVDIRKKSEHTNIENYIINILNVNKKKYINDYIQNVKDHFLKENKANPTKYFRDKIVLMRLTETSDIKDCNYSINNLSMEAKKLFSINKAIICKYIFPLLNYSRFICDSPYHLTGLYSLGIDSSEKFITMIIQNMLCKSTTKYLNAINGNIYVDTFNNNEFFIKEAINRSIRERRKTIVNILTNRTPSSFNIDKIVNIFIDTDELDVAAGILKGLKHNDELFTKIVQSIKTKNNKYVKLYSKLKMLLNGIYTDIILIPDKKGNIATWTPETRDIARIIHYNKEKLTPNQLYFHLHVYHNLFYKHHLVQEYGYHPD